MKFNFWVKKRHALLSEAHVIPVNCYRLQTIYTVKTVLKIKEKGLIFIYPYYYWMNKFVVANIRLTV